MPEQPEAPAEGRVEQRGGPQSGSQQVDQQAQPDGAQQSKASPRGVFALLKWALDFVASIVLFVLRPILNNLVGIPRYAAQAIIILAQRCQATIISLAYLIRHPQRAYNAWQPLAPAVAQRQLVSNGLRMLLVLGVTTAFPPYLSVKRYIVALGDQYVQGRRGGQASVTDGFFYYVEYIVLAILAINILEAVISTTRPARPPQVPDTGLRLTPMRPTAPLIRSTFSPSPPRVAPSYTTPSRPSQSGPNSHLSSTPIRSSPLSVSTSRALNITPVRARTGLYFDGESESSPSKVALRQSQSGGGAQGRGQAQQQVQGQPQSGGQGGASQGLQGSQGQAQQGGGMDQGFVIVEKAEKEWADNVWKGVQGKRSSGLLSK